MTDKTKTILLSAAVVAGLYVFAEFYIKPAASKFAGVKVR